MKSRSALVLVLVLALVATLCVSQVEGKKKKKKSGLAGLVKGFAKKAASAAAASKEFVEASLEDSGEEEEDEEEDQDDDNNDLDLSDLIAKAQAAGIDLASLGAAAGKPDSPLGKLASLFSGAGGSAGSKDTNARLDALEQRVAALENAQRGGKASKKNNNKKH